MNFDDTTEWYMHKLESVLENETHKIHWDFEIKTDHFISSKRLERVVIIKKKTKTKYSLSCGFGFYLAREQKKLLFVRVTVIPIVSRELGTALKDLKERLEELEIRGKIETFSTMVLLRSARILRKVPRRLAVTQTPVKDHQC